MKIEKTKTLTKAQKEIIMRLWNAEYPKQLAFGGIDDLDDFLNRLTNHLHFLLLDENEKIKGWLVTFTRENERWFSIIIDTSEKNKGYGTTLLNEVKKLESNINGWVVDQNDYLKINGEKYLSPIEFYKKNGFSVLNDQRHEREDFSAVKINWSV